MASKCLRTGKKRGLPLKNHFKLSYNKHAIKPIKNQASFSEFSRYTMQMSAIRVSHYFAFEEGSHSSPL